MTKAEFIVEDGIIIAHEDDTMINVVAVLQQVATVKGELPFDATLGLDLTFVELTVNILDKQIQDITSPYHKYFAEPITWEIFREKDRVIIDMVFKLDSETITRRTVLGRKK